MPTPSPSSPPPAAAEPAERRTDRQWLALSVEPLDVAAALDFLRHPAAGGIDLFVGTTRRWTGEARTETTALDYEAYVPMALREMERLAAQAASRWPVERCCLLHRLGRVSVAEASVIVGVATGHRAEAFAATRWLIDTLKAEIPIWKREQFADGQAAWVSPDK